MNLPESWLADVGIGKWTWDPATGTVNWDAACHKVWGIEPGNFDGAFQSFIGMIHPDDRDEVLHVLGELAVTGGDYSVRHRVVWPDGTVHWIEGQGRITVDSQGRPIDGRGIVYALTDRVTFDRERAQLTASEEVARADSIATREKLRFLIDLTDGISGSLNTERVARHLVSIITQKLASGCIVDVQLQDPYGHILTCVGNAAGVQNVVTDSATHVTNAASRLALALDGSAPLPESIVACDTKEQSELLQSDGSMYVAAAPLVAHGTRIGTVTAVRSERAWSKDARALLDAAGRRAAGAFDRAVLHADRSKFVSMFQAAATPRDLPDIPGLDVAAHYRPATDLIRLGGDLYDLFELPDGSWMLAVGDICGKGIVAAGHAELSRTALRAGAMATMDPRETLSVLNRTLLAESSRPMLTAVVARVTFGSGEATFDLAVAGHPPPLLIRGFDDWVPIEMSGTMLGVTSSATFAGVTQRLAPGQSIALYTDGITESRFGSTFFGVERLGNTLSKGWPSSAHSLVSDVASTVDTWAAGQPADDLLLLVASYKPDE